MSELINEENLKANLEDGYGRVPNLLLEALAISTLNGKQMSICLFIIRRTYSWGEKSDKISLKEFSIACDSSESYMSKQIKQLIEWKVIKRVNYEPGKAPTYEINTRVAQWDKGCLNVQGLHESIRQGLYKRTRVPLNKRTRADTTQPIEIPMPIAHPKERFKESIKKDTTTIEETEIPENESLVADIDADSIQQDLLVAPVGAVPTKQDKPLMELESFYLREVRKRTSCSSTDLKDMVHAYEIYKDLEFIKGVLLSATKENIKRNGKCRINSFSYFFPILEDEWERINTIKTGGKTNGESRSHIKHTPKETTKFTEEDAERAGVISL